MAAEFSVHIVNYSPEKEWVVMLPGAGATMAIWSKQVRAFSQHLNVALVELPGHGRRARPVDPQPQKAYEFDALIEALASSVAKAGISSCHVIALSLGTILARKWSRAKPGQILSLTLAGTVADFTFLPRSLLQLARGLQPLMPYMWFYRLFAWVIMPGNVHRLTRVRFCHDAEMLGSAEFKRWFRLARSVLKTLRTLRRDHSTIPTLHVMGEHDHMFLRPARDLAKRENSAFEIVSKVGHVVTFEAADQFNKIALRFIKHSQA